MVTSTQVERVKGKVTMMIEYGADGRAATAYLAVPPGGAGPGVLVLHAWWGLTPFFREVCDRLAGEGFVALAPDLYGDGQTAGTVDEAEALMAASDSNQLRERALAAVDYLRAHPAVGGARLGAVGFSMGGAWSLLLSSLRPDDIAAVVVFYGSGEADFSRARAAYQGHFAADDEWEPLDGVGQMEADLRAAGRDVTFYTYPGTGHWFFEADRPEHHDPEAARLAWQRTVEFLRTSLTQAPAT
jgi:carboxymethylenebutenolidase